jgi:Right handed beta helix region
MATLVNLVRKFVIVLVFGFIVQGLSNCSKNTVIPDIIDDPDTGLVYVDKSCESCDFIVGVDDWKFDGKENNVQPGDTIGIPSGQRSSIFFINIVGTAENPVVIMNCDGRALVGDDITKGAGIQIRESRYFHLTGTGAIESKYGIAALGFMGIQIEYLSSDFEVDGIEVLGAGYGGIIARSEASCDGVVNKETFTQYNTILHDNYVHDTAGGEGFYVGASHWDVGQNFQPGCEGTLLWEPELKGVRIYNNIVKNTGRDGIQVGGAVEDVEIYNNYIENYGLTMQDGQMTGFMINPGTTGKLYNNVIMEGNGYGIFVLGRGDNTVFNNVVIRPSLIGIATGDRNPTTTQGFYIINNTVIEPGQTGFMAWSEETTGTVYYNNIVTSPAIDYFGGGSNYSQSNNIFTDRSDTLMFVNPDELNFQLQSGSPAIDYGRDVSSYDIIFDALGKPRPVGPYDAGAFEYN